MTDAPPGAGRASATRAASRAATASWRRNTRRVVFSASIIPCKIRLVLKIRDINLALITAPRKALGWPTTRRLAHALLWEHSHKKCCRRPKF